MCPWLGEVRVRASQVETNYSTGQEPGSGLRHCDGEFDPGSGQTLAAHLRHASRTRELRLPSGGRVSNTWATCPAVGDTRGKPRLRPHTSASIAGGGEMLRAAAGGACGGLAGWWGESPPRPRSVAGLRGRPATPGLRHGPDSYGRQQLGNFRTGRKPDEVTPRAGGRPSGRKPLLRGTRWTVPLEEAPANYVPAAAVRRRGQALSGITGRKARVGGAAHPP